MGIIVQRAVIVARIPIDLADVLEDNGLTTNLARLAKRGEGSLEIGTTRNLWPEAATIALTLAR